MCFKAKLIDTGNSAIYNGLMRPSTLRENNNKIKRVCNNSTIKLTRDIITMFIWLFGRFLFNRNGLCWISKTKQAREASGLMILLIILSHIALTGAGLSATTTTHQQE